MVSWRQIGPYGIVGKVNGGVMRAAVAWSAGAVIIALALSGCTDLSGEVDSAGHNGYDKRTCTDFRHLAMDAEHKVITRDVGLVRAQQLLDGFGRTSNQEIRDGVVTYVQAYAAGDAEAAHAAAAAMLRLCQF